IILQPRDTVFGDAKNAASLFFLMHADTRQAFAGHFGIVGALVVVGVDHDADSISAFCQESESPGAAKGVIVRVRSKEQDGFGFEALQPRRSLRPKRRKRGKE